MTQSHLAELAGVPAGVLERYELGMLDPGERLARIAEATEVSEHWLRFGSEAPSSPDASSLAERGQALEVGEPESARVREQLAEAQEELRARRVELVQWASELEARERALDERETREGEVESAADAEQVAEARRKVEGTRAEAEKLLAEARARLNELEGRERAISEQAQLLARRNENLDNRELKLKEKTREVKAKRSVPTGGLKQQERVAAELETRIRRLQERESALEQRAAALQNRKERLSERKKQLDAAEGQVGVKGESLARLRKRADRALQAAEELHQRLHEINRAPEEVFDDVAGFRAALVYAERGVADLADELRGSEDGPAATGREGRDGPTEAPSGNAEPASTQRPSQ